MKILIVTRGKLPSPNVMGGAVEYLVQLIIDQNEMVWKHNITLLSIYDEKALEKSKKYTYTNFIFIKSTSLSYKIGKCIKFIINKYTQFYVGNQFISEGINLIKNSNDFDLILVENGPEFILPLKKVYNENTQYALHLHNDFLNKSNRHYAKIVSNYNVFIPISDFLEHKINGDGHYWHNKISNGIDLNMYFNVDKNKLNTFRIKYSINENDIVFMTTSRIVPEKGIVELISAFNALENDNAILFIVGGVDYSSSKETSYLKKCKLLANEFNKKIIFTGYIDNDLMPIYCNLCDIGIIPSLCDEAFGLSLLEFMASGKSIICSDCDAFIEITGNVCGPIISRDENFKSNLRNSMRLLSDDEEFRNILGAKGQDRSKNYSKEIYLNNFDLFFKQMERPYENR